MVFLRKTFTLYFPLEEDVHEFFIVYSTDFNRKILYEANLLNQNLYEEASGNKRAPWQANVLCASREVQKNKYLENK